MNNDSNINKRLPGTTTAAAAVVAGGADSFDLALARELAEFSRRAYAPDAMDTILGTSHDDTKVLIKDAGDYIVLAFRGTANLRDWLTDIRIEKKMLANGLGIHSGFMGAINAILPDLVSSLAHPDDEKPLVITGHSLGGALAALAAYYLKILGFKIRAVYTFASPRVGNAAFRQEYNALLRDITFRVVCSGDLVPLIPGIFTTPCDGYRHVGREVFLDGSLHLDPSRLLELIADGWRTYVAISNDDWDFILQFHSITDDYIPALQRLAPIATL